MQVTLILVISIALQFLAAFLALRLIRITGRQTGWAAIAAAVFLMALRRCVTLFNFLAGGKPPDPLIEWTALMISALMFAGIGKIGPLFSSMKQAEEALKESQRTLATLISNLPGMVYRCRNDRNWTMEFVSDGVLPLIGYTPSDFTEGRLQWGQLIHPDDQEQVWNNTQSALKEKRPYQLVYRIRASSGEEKWVWEQGQGIFYPTGELLLLEGFVTDITERKRAEEALRESEARLRAIIDNEPECVKLVDRNGNLLSINPAGLRMIEAESLAQVEGQCVFPFIAEEHREAFRRLHERVLRGESGSLVFDIVGLKGARRTFETHETPLQDSSGKIFAALGITRDITEQRQTEAQIKWLNQDLERRVAERTSLLEAANKEIESFSYSVSHDLRAPLRAMGGFSRVLLARYSDRLDAQGKDFLQRVDAASLRMADLIEDLLNLSRITRSDMRKEPFDLTGLARSVTEEIRKSEPKRKITLLIEDGLKAEGDPRLLRIALENLFGNAWKFTSKNPSAAIDFGRVKQEGRLVYYIRDNGAGFDMAYVDKLFGPFQRLHTLNEFEGTGIGLATVQRIIHRHGGKVWADGAVEKGATFYFTI